MDHDKMHERVLEIQKNIETADEAENKTKQGLVRDTARSNI